MQLPPPVIYPAILPQYGTDPAYSSLSLFLLRYLSVSYWRVLLVRIWIVCRFHIEVLHRSVLHMIPSEPPPHDAAAPDCAIVLFMPLHLPPSGSAALRIFAPCAGLFRLTEPSVMRTFYRLRRSLPPCGLLPCPPVLPVCCLFTVRPFAVPRITL